MNKKIDSKSTILGMILGSLVVLSIAAATGQSSSGGRFQIALADHHLFKIDTATGQVWRAIVHNPDPKFMAPNIPDDKTPLEAAKPSPASR
jgi:hypothetical protein